MTTGALIFAYNNEQTDYVAMAAWTAKNIQRHQGIIWDLVLENLQKKRNKLWSLHEMENTGGEPDVVAFDDKKNEFIFFKNITQ